MTEYRIVRWGRGYRVQSRPEGAVSAYAWQEEREYVGVPFCSYTHVYRHSLRGARRYVRKAIASDIVKARNGEVVETFGSIRAL